jgi:prevent-host-death family protein
MSVIVNIHEAKTNFSRLLAQVDKGEEVIISKAGKPVARLIPFEEEPKRRLAGSGKSLKVRQYEFLFNYSKKGETFYEDTDGIGHQSLQNGWKDDGYVEATNQ